MVDQATFDFYSSISQFHFLNFISESLYAENRFISGKCRLLTIEIKHKADKVLNKSMKASSILE